MTAREHEEGQENEDYVRWLRGLRTVTPSQQQQQEEKQREDYVRWLRRVLIGFSLGVSAFGIFVLAVLLLISPTLTYPVTTASFNSWESFQTARLIITPFATIAAVWGIGWTLKTHFWKEKP